MGVDKRTTIYKGDVVDLGIENITLPDGQNLDLEVIRHPGGAAIVAIRPDNHVCLLRQYRHAAGGWLWELPAGKIDPGEDAEQTAVRELGEEAGVTSSQWQLLGSFLSTPGFCDERISLYLVQDLTKIDTQHESGELIEIHWTDFQRALDMIHSGDIVDGKTIIGLLHADAALKNQHLST